MTIYKVLAITNSWKKVSNKKILEIPNRLSILYIFRNTKIIEIIEINKTIQLDLVFR